MVLPPVLSSIAVDELELASLAAEDLAPAPPPLTSPGNFFCDGVDGCFDFDGVPGAVVPAAVDDGTPPATGFCASFAARCLS